MRNHDIGNFIDELIHETVYIKSYERQIFSKKVETHLRPEARRIKKLLQDIKKTIVLLRAIRKQYE